MSDTNKIGDIQESLEAASKGNMPQILGKDFTFGQQAVALELARQRKKYSTENDDQLVNRELIFGAKMYLEAGRSKARGEEEGQYVLSAGLYPLVWGGREAGEAKLKKLSAAQMLIRAAALITREVDRMHRASTRMDKAAQVDAVLKSRQL